jgi:hypothetical protein
VHIERWARGFSLDNRAACAYPARHHVERLRLPLPLLETNLLRGRNRANSNANFST